MATFATRHIKETLAFFFHELSGRLPEHANWRRTFGGEIDKPIDPRHGILGTILAGNYTNFLVRRQKVEDVVRIEEPPKYVPPHLRRKGNPSP